MAPGSAIFDMKFEVVPSSILGRSNSMGWWSSGVRDIDPRLDAVRCFATRKVLSPVTTIAARPDSVTHSLALRRPLSSR